MTKRTLHITFKIELKQQNTIVLNASTGGEGSGRTIAGISVSENPRPVHLGELHFRSRSCLRIELDKDKDKVEAAVMELERSAVIAFCQAIHTELGDPLFSFGQPSLARCIAHGCRSVLVRLGCGFCRTLPNSAEEITLLSLLSMGDNKLWISISGFESLGGSQIFSSAYGPPSVPQVVTGNIQLATFDSHTRRNTGKCRRI
ncbi:MAG TPA: hypothetical protein VEI52_16835 [Terriglobales bacterium]|nr:hypothetical protein [Terriglobales bacterium]